MASFNPQPNEQITIGGRAYTVSPHPMVPAFAFGQEGRKAHVFQLGLAATGEKFALKRFKPAFRVKELIDVNIALAQFARWRGLEVANRLCLTPDQYGAVLGQYPDLEYAVLMPWITGSTWYDLLVGMTPLNKRESVTFAKGLVDVLAGLEEGGLAHCDIAAANVIVNPATGQAHLIDIEDMYAPGFSPPAALPAGTDGYAHKTAPGGLWNPNADRFAGAIMLAEMIAWHDPRIRKASEEEHYFAAKEMQQDTPDFRLMMEVLEALDPRTAELFERAWYSEKLTDAPPLREWQEVINEVHHRVRVAEVATDWRPLTLPGADADSEPEEEPQPASPQPEVEEAPEPAEAMPFPHPTDAEEDTQPEEPVAPIAAKEDEQDIVPPPAPAQTSPVAVPQQPSIQTPMPPPAAPAPVVQDTGGDGSPVVEWRSLVGGGGTQASTMPDDVDENGVRTPSDVEFEPLDLSQKVIATQPPVQFDTLGDTDGDGVPDVLDEEPQAEAPQTPPVDDTEPAEYPPVAEPEAGDIDDTTEYAEYIEQEDAAAPAFEPLPLPPDEDEPEPPAEVEVQPEPLAVPYLDHTFTDALSRPHLVWTESYGAEYYLLQESRDRNFASPREFEVGTDDTRWTSPTPRIGRWFYRIAAVDEEGRRSGWSDVVGIRVRGENS